MDKTIRLLKELPQHALRPWLMGADEADEIHRPSYPHHHPLASSTPSAPPTTYTPANGNGTDGADEIAGIFKDS